MTMWEWLLNFLGKKPPAPTPAPKPKPPPVPAPDPMVMVARVIALHNQYRTAHGLSILVADARLMLAAQRHADDMFVHRDLSHAGSDGSDSGTRILRAGYVWSFEGENIEEGLTSPDSVMASWLSSPGHLANIRNPAFRNIGVGLAGGDWWCVVFGAPK